MGTTWDAVRRGLAGREPPPAQGSSRRAAVALVLREASEGLELLFIRRAEHPQDPWSGQMAFPGGRAEPGDADLRTTAVRETAEELGVSLDTDAEYLGPLEDVQAMARMRPMNLTIRPFVFRLTREVEMRLSDEVTSVHWIPLDPLLGETLRSTFEYRHEGVSLEFPCLRVEDIVIWGLTYRMFRSFEARLLAP
jgi:8-oxo-dGTP pyrophosphatase MutT (NUDIX family)